MLAVPYDAGEVLSMRATIVAILVLAVLAAGWLMFAGDEVPARADSGSAASTPTNESAIIQAAPSGAAEPAAIPAVAYDGESDVAAEEPAPLVDGVEVRGRIADAQDKPLGDESVTLNLRRELFGRIQNETRAANSNAQGAFSFKGVPIGAVVNVRCSPKVALETKSAEHAVPQKGLDVGTLTAQRGESLSGYVRTAAGQGVAGVRVVASPKTADGIMFFGTIENAAATTQRAATTNADGHFRIQGLTPGTVQVRAREAGSLAEARCVVEAGAPKEPVVLVLPAGSELCGIVTDSEGHGLADAQVVVTPGTPNPAEAQFGMMLGGNWGPASTGRCTTDAEGKFRLLALSSEMKPRVRVTKPGFVTAEQDIDGRDCTIRMQRAGVVYGVVSSGAAGTVLEGLKVAHRQTQWTRFSRGAPRVVYGKEAAEAAGVPDTAGLYALLDAQPGTFTLSVTAAEHVGLNYEQMTTAAERVDRHDVVLPREAIIEGVVLDPTGRPAADAEVTADSRVIEPQTEHMQSFSSQARVASAAPLEVSVSPSMPFRRMQTDAAGRFRFAGVGDGNYKLQASHGEHASTQLLEVRVEKSASPPPVKLQLAAGGAIEGVALDADGKAKPFATIQLDVHQEKQPSGMMRHESRAGHREALCDDSGKFHMGGLPAGRWDLRMDSASGSGQRMRFMSMGMGMENDNADATTCDVIEGQVTKVELREPSLGAVEGVVRCAGSPVPGVKMELNVQKKSGDESMGFVGFPMFNGEQVKTDAEGRFRFDKRKPGDYEVVAWASGAGEPVKTEVVVAERGTSRTELDLPGAAIEGRVTSKETGLAIAGVSVRATRNRPTSESPNGHSSGVFAISTSSEDGDAMVMRFGGAEEVRTDADGRFTLRYLKAGTYTLNFEGASIIEGSMKDIEVAAEALRSGVNYAASQGATLVIHATNFESSGIEFCHIEAKHIDTNDVRHAGIQGRGRTTVRGLKPGRYKVTVRDNEGNIKLDKEVSVIPGTETLLELRL